MKALCVTLALALTPLPVAAFDVTDPKAIAPILDMTRSSWVALRDWDGVELLYFSHLEAWRCALSSVRYSVNGADWQVWTLAPCQTGTPAPNALPEGYLPYIDIPKNLLQSIAVEVTMADGTALQHDYQRAQILMP